MQCRLCSPSDYPYTYYQLHKPNLNEPYVCPHLNRQSYVDVKTGVRRSVFSARHISRFPEVKTVRDLFEHGLKISRFRPCLGRRFDSKQPYMWLKYQEVDEKIRAFGSALVKIMGHRENTPNIVGIYGRNSPEWFITQHACAAYGFTIVPLYATLGDEAMQHILTETEMTVLFCHSDTEALHMLEDFNSSLECIIIGQVGKKFDELCNRFASKVMIFSFNDFLSAGNMALLPKSCPKPTDLYIICYTSGSTGTPKGVLIEHQQLVDAVFAIIETTEAKACFSNSTHLSYLPFAHIMEQVNSSVVIIEGAKMGFLTDSIEGLINDIEALKPTMLTAVPRVLTRLYSTYQKALGGSALKARLVKHVVKTKLSEQKRGKFNHRSLLDTLCFGKLRKALGGNMYGVITGGAPLLPDILKFIRAAFGSLIIEAYGSTETTGVTTMTLVGDYRSGTVGAVSYGLEIKLVDVPELDLVVSRENRGEICVKGNRCTKGYYKNPAQTAELIDKDGWLHTGDIGEWTPEGALRIVDRLKNIFKLSQGEYVAPEKVEAAYLCCPLISQIFVDGNAFHNYLVAIVVPDFTELRACLPNLNADLTKLTDVQLCENADVRRFFLNKMNEVAVDKKLKGFEKVKAIYLTNNSFSMENGMLTPTLKIARYKARRHYATIVDSLYEQMDSGEFAATL